MRFRMTSPASLRDLRLWPALVFFLCASLCPVAVRAEQPATRPADAAGDEQEVKTQFIKFVEDNHGGGKLETAIATYKNDAGVTVHLVGALHIGEKEYYDGLNKTFEGYDALLYEMVKPKDAPAPRPGFKSNSMVSMFQRFLKDQLELTFQLDAIDYGKSNFVHADLDAETFAKMQEERGE